MTILKKILPLLSAFILLSISMPTAAAHLEVSFEEEGSCKILPHTYEINITNTHDSEDLIRLSRPREFSRWMSLSRSIMRIQAGETETTELTIEAPRNVELGEYQTNFSIFSEDYEDVSTTGELCFIVLRDYSMIVRDFAVDKEEYGPMDQVNFSVTVENDGTKDFDDGEFRIEVTKEGEQIATDLEKFELETGKGKTVASSINLKEHQAPGTYDVMYEVRGAGHKIQSGEASFEVMEMANYEISEESDGRYIIRTNTINAENRGNILEQKEINRTAVFPLSLLTTAEGADVTREGLHTVYSWNIELEPGQSTQLSYQINYWPLYILIILLALIAFRLFLYMKAPVVKKEVVKSEISEDKRVLTISLHVKNRFFGKAKNVILEDSVLSVTRVLDEFDTVKPNIERKDDETTLRWKLGEMLAGDDRVIHYKVKVLVESVDELVFPPAKVRGAVGKRTFERSSSKVKLGV
ncbi:MAG: hypothetical protein ACLFQ8_00175 [Candidatus Aenigmatarchaeota archaeon]